MVEGAQQKPAGTLVPGRFGGCEEGRGVGGAHDGPERLLQCGPQPRVVVAAECPQEMRDGGKRARVEQGGRRGLPDVHVRVVEAGGDRLARPTGPCRAQGQQGRAYGPDVRVGGQRDERRGQGPCVLARGVVGQQGDDVLAHVRVAVAEQAVHPGPGGRGRGDLEQRLEQHRPFAAGEPGSLQQAEQHRGEERVARAGCRPVRRAGRRA